jgi:HSP20 family molecular chaperone IbpA
MWAEACELLERAERMQRQFFQIGSPARRPAWEPPVDIFETEEELIILVALPGVEAAQIQIGVETDVLIVNGVRSVPALFRHAVLHRLEIPHGHFERRIELPSSRFRLQRQEFVNGLLLLVLRKL